MGMAVANLFMGHIQRRESVWILVESGFTKFGGPCPITNELYALCARRLIFLYVDIYYTVVVHLCTYMYNV